MLHIWICFFSTLILYCMSSSYKSRSPISNLWDLMLDDLRYNWCNNNGNKVYNKFFVLKSLQNHPPHHSQSMERLAWWPSLGRMDWPDRLAYGHEPAYVPFLDCVFYAAFPGEVILTLFWELMAWMFFFDSRAWLTFLYLKELLVDLRAQMTYLFWIPWIVFLDRPDQQSVTWSQ